MLAAGQSILRDALAYARDEGDDYKAALILTTLGEVVNEIGRFGTLKTPLTGTWPCPLSGQASAPSHCCQEPK